MVGGSDWGSYWEYQKSIGERRGRSVRVWDDDHPGGGYPLLMESTRVFFWDRVGTVDLGNLCNIEGRNLSERSPGASLGSADGFIGFVQDP